jgi:sugar lactone lactonase YvrE
VVWSRTAPTGKFFFGEATAIAFSPDGSTLYVPGYPNQSLYALDVQGQVAWSDSLDSEVRGAMAVDNEGNIYAWTRTKLVSLSETGKIRWSIETGSYNWDITIDNMGNIAYMADGYLCSVTNDGEEWWKVRVDDGDYNNPLVSDADGTVYCITGTGGTNYNVRAVTSSGEVKWTLPINAYMKWGGPALTKEGYLIITDSGDNSGTGIPNSVYVIE